MVFNIIGILIGISVLIGGIYYLVKEKDDKESKKIYSVVTAIGALILIGMAVKILVL
ncbi:MAG: hypothetical protein Q4E74_11175 [Ruminococcus sp.]|nr:hypothetical protein [Ruminococcus sp.]